LSVFTVDIDTSIKSFFKQFLFSVASGENLVSKSSLQVQETGQGEGNGRTEST